MKYGPRIIKEMQGHLEAGMGRKDTCALVDISYETFTVWMKKPEFEAAIFKAETKCKEKMIHIIQKAAPSTWTAAAWWLERKHHDEFALKNKTELTGKDGGKLIIMVEGENPGDPARR